MIPLLDGPMDLTRWEEMPWVPFSQQQGSQKNEAESESILQRSGAQPGLVRVCPGLEGLRTVAPQFPAAKNCLKVHEPEFIQKKNRSICSATDARADVQPSPERLTDAVYVVSLQKHN